MVNADKKTKASYPNEIGRYEVTGELGEGGFSRVYAGRDPVLSRDVAIKVMKEPAFNPRLRAEGNRLGRMTGHPSILEVYDYGEHYSGENGKLDYLVLEKCECSLRDEINMRQGRPDWKKYAVWGIQLLEGLSAIHEEKISGRPVVHHDLKPSNVLVHNGNIRLGDFNLVTDEEANNFMTSVIQSVSIDSSKGMDKLMGTVAYLAPEQKRAIGAGREATVAVNIHQTGQILNELLTGRRLDEIGRKEGGETFGYPVWLDDIIGRATSFLPEERYQSAKEMAHQLQRGLESAFDGPSFGERAWEKTRELVKGTKTTAKFIVKWGTSPLWWPIAWYEHERTSIGEPVIPALFGTFFYAGLTAGVLGILANNYENKREVQTLNETRAVLQAQPDNRYLVYRDRTNIRATRLNTILNEDREIISIDTDGVRAGDVLSLSGSSLLFAPYDTDNQNRAIQAPLNQPQVYELDLNTHKVKPMINYNIKGNSWLNGKFFYAFAAENKAGEQALFVQPLDYFNPILKLGDGSAWREDNFNGKWRKKTPLQVQVNVPGSDIVFENGIQFNRSGNSWGDIELPIRGSYPFIIEYDFSKTKATSQPASQPRE